MAYLDSSPSPSATPNSAHQPLKPRPRRGASTSASKAADQNSSRKGSVVIITADSDTAGMVIHAAPLQPPRAPPNSARPSRTSSAAVPPWARADPSLTAPSPSPNSAVVAAMAQATMGGLE